MLTIDASVFVSSLRLTEIYAQESQRLLNHVRQDETVIVCPTLVIAETVAAIARTSRDAEAALQAGMVLDGIAGLRMAPLDSDLARLAASLAAAHFLRGADAVYLAVAQQHDATLITWDIEMLQRGPAVLPTLTPTDWLLRATQDQG